MTAHRLLTAQLYEEVVRTPSGSADHLWIVAGYATPAMLGRVLNDLTWVKISLVVGMVGSDGVLLSDHKGFLELQAKYASRVNVSYTRTGRSIHSKLYVWSTGGAPTVAFAGSSNFTQNGFLLGRGRGTHSEVLSAIDPIAGKAELDRLSVDSVSITDPQLSQRVRMRLHTLQPTGSLPALSAGAHPDLAGLPSVILPLVRTSAPDKGLPHDGWGLNWGQRPERNNKSEAVIPIPAIARTNSPDFFPTGVPGDRPYFIVTTDDGDAILMVVAEQGNKALHSVPSNAEIGKWFRRRLGVVPDAAVTIADFRQFGSRFVRIYRIDDETFHLEYNPSIEQNGVAEYGFAPM